MKKFLLAVAVVSIGLTSCKKTKETKTETQTQTEAVAQTLTETQTSNSEEVKNTTTMTATEIKVDTEKSVVEWIGSEPTSSHNGTVKLSSGKFNLSENKLVGGEFVIDMNTITDLDVKSEKYRKKLENHLKDGDFFDVKQFPTAKFVITDVKENGEKVDIKGDLTVRDNTKSIVFPATFKATETGYSLVSDTFKINRLDYGITFKSKTIMASLKDEFIKDLIEFSVKVEAKK